MSMRMLRWGEVQLQPILNFCAWRCVCSALRSGPFVPKNKLIYIWLEANEKYLTTTGIHPRTMQSTLTLCIFRTADICPSRKKIFSEYMVGERKKITKREIVGRIWERGKILCRLLGITRRTNQSQVSQCQNNQ